MNALVYVKYNTKLRERSIKRRQNIDPILVDQIDSDDEWIAEKEDPVLPVGSWLEDDEQLFDVDAVRIVPINNIGNVGSSSHAKRKVTEVSSK